MPNDLRIRQIGRAKIEKDSAAGFQKLTRKYTIEGPKASIVGLNGQLDGVPLFREYGEPDEEFPDHYLINQVVDPTTSVDKATLTRQYAQVRDTWYAQETSESNNLKKLTRKFAVIKNSNHVLNQLGTPNLGYDTTAWSIHPKTGQNSPDESDNWDMLPTTVLLTEPKEVTYQDGNASGFIPSFQNKNTRVVYPRTVKVISNTDGNVELEITGAAPWKLGEQAFDSREGESIIDDKQSLEEGQEFIILADPRESNFNVDNPDTYNAMDHYTPGVGSTEIGSTVTVESENIRPVTANIPSVYAQTSDGYIVESLEYEVGETNFVEDLAILESQQLPIQTGQISVKVDGNLHWVRASCSLDTSNPGLDMWTVSWVGPVAPYWKAASGKEKKESRPTIVAFDHLGLRTFQTTTVSSGGGYVLTYFIVAEQLPIQTSGYQKNSGSVSVDVKIIGVDGSNSTSTFRQSFRNAAMYKNLAGGGQGGGGGGTGSSGSNSGSTGVRMSWPTKGNVLGLDKGYKQVACYGQGCNGIEWIKEGHTPDTKRAWEFHYQKPKDDLPIDCPCFQGQPIQVAAGHITWDSTIWNLSVTGTPTSVQVTPIFFHNKTKIWKVESTYFQ